MRWDRNQTPVPRASGNFMPDHSTVCNKENTFKIYLNLTYGLILNYHDNISKQIENSITLRTILLSFIKTLLPRARNRILDNQTECFIKTPNLLKYHPHTNF